MALEKQKRVKRLGVDMDTGKVKLVIIVDIIDTDTGNIEASKVREVRIKKGNDAKAMKFGIKNITDLLWY